MPTALGSYNGHMEAEQQPLVMVFVDDLFFAPQIEDVARRLGFRVETIAHANQLGSNSGTVEQPPGEALEGRVGTLLDRLTTEVAALAIFDLENKSIPWAEWITRIKSSPATRRMPIVCFGRHTEVDTLKEARAAGADQVLARSRFVELLPQLLQEHARVPDVAALSEACAGELAPRAAAGIELFNTGEYFEAHEELEEAWRADESPARELYRAILQVAVAYLQIERGNYKGAAKMFLRVRQWINPLPDQCRGVDVAKLRSDAISVREMLEELGPNGITEFDSSQFKPVVLIPKDQGANLG